MIKVGSRVRNMFSTARGCKKGEVYNVTKVVTGLYLCLDGYGDFCFDYPAFEEVKED